MRPAVAWLLAGVFLALIAAVPVLELAGVAGSGGDRAARGLVGRLRPGRRARPDRRRVDDGPLAANRLLLAEIARIEDALDERSLLQETVVPYAQWAEVALLGGRQPAGVRRRGRSDAGERWLFYRPDVEHVIGRGFLEPDVLRARREGGDSWREPPHPDPRPAIEAFRRQLAARGIELLVVPTPVKPMIEPERLTGPGPARPAGPGGGGMRRPLRNPSFARLVRDLAAAGVAVFDPGPVLARGRRSAARSGGCRATSTCGPTPTGRRRPWTGWPGRSPRRWPSGSGPPERPVAYDRQPVRVPGIGDLDRMLRLPPAAGRFPPQEVTARRVTTPEGALWRPERGAEVLLLGDSFTNVYSQDALGWGGGAGLAEQLAYHLGRPVDRIAVNAGGAHTTREALAAQLRDDPGASTGSGWWSTSSPTASSPAATGGRSTCRLAAAGADGPDGAARGGGRSRGPAGAPAGAGASGRQSGRRSTGAAGLGEASRSGSRTAPATGGSGRPPRRRGACAGSPRTSRGSSTAAPTSPRTAPGWSTWPARRRRTYPETRGSGELRLIELAGARRETGATRREPADARAGPWRRPPRATTGATARRCGAATGS